MKRLVSAVLACALTVGLFAGCGQAPSSPSTPASAGSQPVATPTPEPPPPPYTAEVLTGEKREDGTVPNTRITAIMVNNIAACRPQRGLSDAKVLFEIRVEGGISRFMALYDDYKTIPTVGPVRSGRDQFFRLILPYQALFVHVGESSVQEEFIENYDYGDYNLDGKYVDNVVWRDQSRLNQGYSLEHTAYTSGEKISALVTSRGIDMNRTYNSPVFNFVNYDEPARTLTGGEANEVTVYHSQTYRTRLTYDSASGKYLMSQYAGGSFTPTVDENNNVQLNFDNVLVLFTDIHTYPGHESTDLQYAEYNYGGVGYYYNGGRYEKIRWRKNNDMSVLEFLDGDGNEIPVQLNTGTTYVAVAPLSEAEKFEAPDEVQQAADSAAQAG